MSTEEYGLVDFINILISLAMPIITLQIEQAVFRNLIDCREDEESKKTIISTGFYEFLLHVIFLSVIFITFSNYINNIYKYYLMVNVIAFCFTSFFQQVARGVGNNKVYSISGFLSAISTILFNILFLVTFKMGAKGMLIGMFLGQFLSVVYLYFALKMYKYIILKSYDKNLLKKMLKYSIPLIPNAISFWILNASDRIIVTSIFGLSFSGILAASHKFSSAYIILYNVFHLSWLESVSEHIKDKDIVTYFNRIFNSALKLFISLSFLIIAAMPFIYNIMIDKKYFIGYYQIPIIMIGAIFNVLVALETAVYYAKKNTKAIAMTSFIAALVNIIVHLLLIGKLNLYAASISTMIAYLVMSLYRYYDIKHKYFNIRIESKILLISFIFLIVILPIYYIENNIYSFISLLISVIFALIVNKKEIKYLKNFLMVKLKKGFK